MVAATLSGQRLGGALSLQRVHGEKSEETNQDDGLGIRDKLSQ